MILFFRGDVRNLPRYDLFNASMLVLQGLWAQDVRVAGFWYGEGL